MLPTSIYGQQPWDRTEDLSGNGVTVSPWKLSKLETWHAFIDVPGTTEQAEVIFVDMGDYWAWKVQYPFSDPFEDFVNRSEFNDNLRFERELVLAECMLVVESRAIAAGAAWGAQIELMKRKEELADILNRATAYNAAFEKAEAEYLSIQIDNMTLVTPESCYETEEERARRERFVEREKRRPAFSNFIVFDDNDIDFDGYEEAVLGIEPDPVLPDTSESDALKELLMAFPE